ncbi:ABC transporter permease [Tissierella pigra]|uniref:FtsX-like permease family protein n=1 Tax=Tissierella pigra TaxID=2607614 RepID=A0A6N7XMA5_9FIRM|nr:ABC transporter permease [Tissierella pigra]MSU03231.1 FtsX-like permease family protein [Tissierella pigra]
MQLTEMLRIIWINILQNKFKVVLSSLGIIVGATTIVLVIAIGKGGEAEIIKQFGDLSAATIYINPDESKAALSGNVDFSKIERLNLEQIYHIKEENPYLTNIMLLDFGSVNVMINGKEFFRTVTGVTAEYEHVMNLSTAYGENLTKDDEENKTLVAVLGFNVAEQSFGNAEYAVGQYISVNDKLLKVVGVLPRRGDSVGLVVPDSSIFIPYSVGKEYIFSNRSIPRAVALADDVSHVDSAMKWIRSSLTYYFDNGDAYTIEDVGSRMEVATQSARIMSVILISVAVIVFVVSGIGIMNVLFVSVKERTREIGILKALGCSEGNILLQFLLESVTISAFGSVAGMLLSIFILPLMRYIDIPVTPSAGGQLAALFFSLLTGTAFGYYPAYRASKQKPIDALNYE